MNESMMDNERESFRQQVRILKENNLDLENKFTLLVTENERLANKLHSKEE